MKEREKRPADAVRSPDTAEQNTDRLRDVLARSRFCDLCYTIVDFLQHVLPFSELGEFQRMNNRVMTILLCFAMIGAAAAGCAYSAHTDDVEVTVTVETESAQTAQASSSEKTAEAEKKEEKEEENASSAKSEAASAETSAEKASDKTEKTDKKDKKKSDDKKVEDFSDIELHDVEITQVVSEASAEPDKVSHADFERIDVADDVQDTLWGPDAAMQIVVFGDSQFGNYLGVNGIAARLSRDCQANVYNLAMGGTTCALLPGETEDGDSTSFYGMVRTVCGMQDPSFLKEDHPYTYSVFEGCDFSKTDVFVIEYGVNDWFRVTPLTGGSRVRSVFGALDMGIGYLMKAYPDAKIVVCDPTYAQFFDGQSGAYLGDGNILSNGSYCLVDIANGIEGYASTAAADVVYATGMYHELINSSNAADYLEDGIHMNDAGRKIYCERLARFIIRMMGYEIEAGADPSHVEWRK